MKSRGKNSWNLLAEDRDLHTVSCFLSFLPKKCITFFTFVVVNKKLMSVPPLSPNWLQISLRSRIHNTLITLWHNFIINRRRERWKSWRPLANPSDFFIVLYKHKISDSVNKSLLWSSVDSLHQLEFAIWICVNTVQSRANATRSACILNIIPQHYTGHHTNDTHQFRIWKVERKKIKVKVCLLVI